MSAASRVLSLAVIGMLVACASSGRSETEPALIFSGLAVPECAFELVGEVSVSVTMRGDRSLAQGRLHPMLARAAERQGADGAMNITLDAPERVAISVPAGRRPTEADFPAVPWTGRTQAIRFVDPECRG